MESKIKKISIVVYSNGNIEESKKTLQSVISQKLSNMFYDLIIINDNATKRFVEKLEKFLKYKDVTNYQIFSLNEYYGLPMSFDFLLKNKIIKNEYVTIIKSQDVIFEDWLQNFLNNLYRLKMDLYLYNIKDEFIIPKEKIGNNGKKYIISKSKIIMPFLPGKVSNNESISTYPLFLGKIWRTDAIKNIVLSENKILYQDIYMYYQMLMFTKNIWYEKEYAGIIRRGSWIPKVMDKKRIELLSATLNKMISQNRYINGQVLQLLALALENTPKEEREGYILTNHSYLQNNYVIVRSYHLSKRKILKLTKPFIKYGEIPKDNKR